MYFSCEAGWTPGPLPLANFPASVVMVMIARSRQDRSALWRSLGIPPPHRTPRLPQLTTSNHTYPPPPHPPPSHPRHSNRLCPSDSESKCRNEHFSHSRLCPSFSLFTRTVHRALWRLIKVVNAGMWPISAVRSGALQERQKWCRN